MMDLKRTEMGYVWRFREGSTKKSEKQHRIFEPYLPIVPVKVEFCLLSYDLGSKDNIK